PVPPPRPGEKPFEVPNPEPEPPPGPSLVKPDRPQPLPVPVPYAPSSGQEGTGPMPYLTLPFAWAGALLALPVGLKMGWPVIAIVVAAMGLGVGLLSLGFAAARGRAARAWGIFAITAVMAAGSALVAAAYVPRAEVKKPDTRVELDPYQAWVLPDATKHPLTTGVLSVHPGHVVVLVREVLTNRDEVEKLLREPFPDRVTRIPATDAERKKLLDEKLAESIRSITDTAAVMKVLSEMEAADAHFKGYEEGKPKETLEVMIPRGGVYTLGVKKPNSAQKHGSLLHAKSIDDLAEFTNVKDAQKLKHLAVLREAIRDYASLYYALAAAGDRPATLVGRTANGDAPEKTLQALEAHGGTPVFVPRPPPRLVDAVDPADPRGGGQGDYELSLPVPFYWRQVGKDDRDGADPKKLPDAAGWTRFEKDGEAKWSQLTVENTRGPQLVASFDLAVPVAGGMVVLFRNQNLYLHKKREE